MSLTRKFILVIAAFALCVGIFTLVILAVSSKDRNEPKKPKSNLVVACERITNSASYVILSGKLDVQKAKSLLKNSCVERLRGVVSAKAQMALESGCESITLKIPFEPDYRSYPVETLMQLAQAVQADAVAECHIWQLPSLVPAVRI